MRDLSVTSLLIVRLVRSIALYCGLLFAGPVLAQVAPTVPPLVQTVDRNGVDLISGALERREVHASVGGNGASGLSEIAYDSSGGDNNQYFVTLPRGWNGSNNMTAVVGLGKSSLEFTRFVSTPNGFADSRKTGAVLQWDTGPFAFVLTDKSGAVYRFSARYTLPPVQDQDPTDRNIAAIDSITYPTGEVVTFYYRDAAYLSFPNGYRLQSVVSSLGYQLKYEYLTDTPDTFGGARVSKVTALNMAYDTCDPAAAHCTTTNTYPISTYGFSYASDGAPTTYTYEDAMLLRTTMTDTAPLIITRPTGVTKAVTHTYNSFLKQNMITSVSDGVGTWTYHFSPISSLATVTDPLGHVTTYNVTQRKGITKVSDAQGREVSYVYDLVSRPTGASFPEGNGVVYTLDDRNNVTQAGYFAKGSGQVLSMTTSAGYDAACTQPKTCNQPRYTIDARGAQTDYTYDNGHGGVLTKTLPAGPNGVRPKVTYAYQQFYPWYRNPAGVLTQAAAPVYRLVSESICQTQATCVGTADETRTVYAYGAPGVPNNLQVSSKTVQSGDGALQATTSYTYTPAGDVKTIDGPMPNDTVSYFYNAARQQIGEIGPDPDGPGGALLYRASRTTYRADGQVALVETGTATSQADNAMSSFTALAFTRNSYGPTGQVVKVEAGQP